MKLDAGAPARLRAADQRIPASTCSRWSTAFSTCRRSRPAISRSRPEPFAPRPGDRPMCCDLLALQGARSRDRPRRAHPRRDLPEIVADKRARQADPAQSLVQRHQVHRSRRARHGERRAPRQRSSCSRSTTPASASTRATCARIGDPFFQARGSYDRPYDGTGLGLSIVKGLVGAARRTASRSRSRLGEGTCMTVRLPVDCERLHHHEPASKVQALVQRGIRHPS